MRPKFLPAMLQGEGNKGVIEGAAESEANGCRQGCWQAYEVHLHRHINSVPWKTGKLRNAEEVRGAGGGGGTNASIIALGG